jgi:hypothetical protein
MERYPWVAYDTQWLSCSVNHSNIVHPYTTAMVCPGPTAGIYPLEDLLGPQKRSGGVSSAYSPSPDPQGPHNYQCWQTSPPRHSSSAHRPPSTHLQHPHTTKPSIGGQETATSIHWSLVNYHPQLYWPPPGRLQLQPATMPNWLAATRPDARRPTSGIRMPLRRAAPNQHCPSPQQGLSSHPRLAPHHLLHQPAASLCLHFDGAEHP